MKYLKTLLLLVLIVTTSCKPTKYADLEEGLYANMETNKGNILLKLEFEQTPVTVANFVSLATGTNDFVTDSLKGKPYYNGLIFHRVIKDFMIQGGDPTGTGMGSPGYKFIDEFPRNENDSLILTHNKAGILSMANSGPTTNGSQFFITHKETPWLDGVHTVFGNVIKGQNVVDSIAQNDTIKNVEIISLGKAAKSFDAGERFSDYLKKFEEETKAKEERLLSVYEKAMEKFELNKANATELASGLKYVITEPGNGEKPKAGVQVRVKYTGYFTDGKLLDTSEKEIAELYEKFELRREQVDGYSPLTTSYDAQSKLIAGLKEGLQLMRVGDKAIFFIPSHLGWGPQGGGNVIPPNSDLVFELELVEIVK